MTDASQIAPPAPGPTPAAVASPYPQRGAWSFFSAAVGAPRKTLDLCRARRIDFLDVMVNDGSADHLKPVPFVIGHHGLGRTDILAAAQVWRDGGLRFGFTTWISPRTEWIEGMALVGELAAQAGAESVTIDAEEPWIVRLRKTPLPEVHALADRATGHLRRTCGARIGITHTVYADWPLVDALLDYADEDVPQAYATGPSPTSRGNATHLKPGDLERVAVARWERHGDARLPIIMGAAGWSQEGAYGLGYLPAWRASLEAGRTAGASGVRVWQLGAIDVAEAAVLREVWS